MCGQANTDYHNENVRVIPNKRGADIDEINEKCCPNWYTANVWNVDINKIDDCILLLFARYNIMKLRYITQRMLNCKETFSMFVLTEWIERYSNEPIAAKNTISIIKRIWNM